MMSFIIKLTFVYLGLCLVSCKVISKNEENAVATAERSFFSFGLGNLFPTVNPTDLTNIQAGNFDECPNVANGTIQGFGLCLYPCTQQSDCSRSRRYRCCPCRGFQAQQVTLNCLPVRG